MHMSTDIHGYIEIRQDNGTWVTRGNISECVGRNYEMFGLLFGVRNYAHYDPIAPFRGIPLDVSDAFRSTRWEEDAHSDSWITYQEIAAIDWEHGKAPLAGQRISVRREGESSPFMEFLAGGNLSAEDYATLSRGETIIRNGISYCHEVHTYNDALSSDWSRLFERMKELSVQHGGPDRVRLVVWFDN